jgi:4-hydroxythreonine-4-phosphate dehydrogenase
MALPLALTMGEPAGIGGEIALQAWLRRHGDASGGDGDVPPFYVIDEPRRLAALAAALGWEVPIAAIAAPEEAAAVFLRALPVLPVGDGAAVRARPGGGGAAGPDPADAALVVGAIEQAVADVRAGRAAAIVTNPIHKGTLYRAGFRHPGHTEFLAELAGGGAASVMMLAGRELRVVPVTIHLALREAVARLTGAAIVHAGRVTHDALVRDFALPAPVIAVAGLNPHAGEGGALGREEIDIVAPAVAELRAAGIDARGPFAADAMFHARARRGYDAALCMYHDQALIPIKTIDFDGAVNVTLGLPFVRTSPDHGTAFDIAGSGTARPDSLIAALKLAATMAARRRQQAG